MPTKQDFEQLGTSQLAMLCQKMAQVSDLDPKVAQQALHLRQEWARLQALLEPMLVLQKERERKLAIVRGQMIEFLALSAR